jgi:chromosome segregation ATPase
MDESTIDAIHRLMTEMDETRGEIKTLRDAIKDILEQNDEYKTMQDELKELTTKRTELKKVLQEDKDYQLRNSELEEEKFKLKDLHEIMSHHLVTYYNETKSTQIKDGDGEVRQVIISAKIGRPEVLIEDQS